ERSGESRDWRPQVSRRGLAHPVQVLKVELGLRLGDGHGIRPAEARAAELPAVALAAQQSLEREVAERVDAEVVLDLCDRLERPDELSATGRVDAVETGVGHRGRPDTEVDLAGARAPQQPHQLAAGRAAHDGIVDHDDALAVQDLPHRVELDAYREIAGGLI